MEMAFAGEEDIMLAIERLILEIWVPSLKPETHEKFPRMTYQDAMASYGSDKPDLRYGAKVHQAILSMLFGG